VLTARQHHIPGADSIAKVAVPVALRSPSGHEGIREAARRVRSTRNSDVKAVDGLIGVVRSRCCWRAWQPRG